jgi:Fe-S cluster assembly protein SufB
MGNAADQVKGWVDREYRWGFVSPVESDTIPKGLSEDTIRRISARKNEPEFLLERRLKAYRHWLTMIEPRWSTVCYSPIDFQEIAYYSAPRKSKDGPSSLDEVDPELLRTYERLGVPLQ